MANRATATFVISIVGAAYQLISTPVAGLVDRNSSLIYYNYSYEILFFTSLIVIWSASHILEDWKGRITWPTIILVLGIANVSLVIMAYYAQSSSPIQISYNGLSLGAVLALILGPVMLTVAGILGFSAVRQYSREHGRAVIGHA
jgi:hypothetical protein